jgi:hypothetical protein
MHWKRMLPIAIAIIATAVALPSAVVAEAAPYGWSSQQAPGFYRLRNRRLPDLSHG